MEGRGRQQHRRSPVACHGQRGGEDPAELDELGPALGEYGRGRQAGLPVPVQAEQRRSTGQHGAVPCLEQLQQVAVPPVVGVNLGGALHHLVCHPLPVDAQPPQPVSGRAEGVGQGGHQATAAALQGLLGAEHVSGKHSRRRSPCLCAAGVCSGGGQGWLVRLGPQPGALDQQGTRGVQHPVLKQAPRTLMVLLLGAPRGDNKPAGPEGLTGGELVGPRPARRKQGVSCQGEAKPGGRLARAPSLCIRWLGAVGTRHREVELADQEVHGEGLLVDPDAAALGPAHQPQRQQLLKVGGEVLPKRPLLAGAHRCVPDKHPAVEPGLGQLAPPRLPGLTLGLGHRLLGSLSRGQQRRGRPAAFGCRWCWLRHKAHRVGADDEVDGGQKGPVDPHGPLGLHFGLRLPRRLPPRLIGPLGPPGEVAEVLQPLLQLQQLDQLGRTLRQGVVARLPRGNQCPQVLGPVLRLLLGPAAAEGGRPALPRILPRGPPGPCLL